MTISWIDFIRAFLLLIFLRGVFYLLFPAAIQGFAVRCLIDAKVRNLRLFGVLQIALFVFLLLLANKYAEALNAR
mgnify:FL=1